MSRLATTRGIVLRHSAYSETSRVIHWLTEDRGRISTVAKGAMRPRNAMLGQFDQLYTCELVYYAHDREAAYITRELSPLAVRARLRRDWRAALAGLYLCDLALRATPAHVPAPELYRLLEEALDVLDTHGWLEPLPLLFELRLLALLGLAPRFDRCATCDRPLEAGVRTFFEVRRGGMVCARCAPDTAAIALGPDVRSILLHWQRAEGWNPARTARCTAAQRTAMDELLGAFLAYHLDLAPVARQSVLPLLYRATAERTS